MNFAKVDIIPLSRLEEKITNVLGQLPKIAEHKLIDVFHVSNNGKEAFVRFFYDGSTLTTIITPELREYKDSEITNTEKIMDPIVIPLGQSNSRFYVTLRESGYKIPYDRRKMFSKALNELDNQSRVHFNGANGKITLFDYTHELSTGSSKELQIIFSREDLKLTTKKISNTSINQQPSNDHYKLVSEILKIYLSP